MTTETAVVASVGTIKVGSQSNPSKVGGCIAATVRDEGKAEIQTIGAGALNQAIKAIAIARGYLATSKIDLICYPAFVDVDIDGSERTAIRLFVEPRVKKQIAAKTSATVPTTAKPPIAAQGRPQGRRLAEEARVSAQARWGA